MASSANYETSIYAAVKSKLQSELSDLIAHTRIYEGGRQNIPYARFPCLMLSVVSITPESRGSDTEKLAMRFSLRYIVADWSPNDGFTNTTTGLLALARRIDSAIWAGAMQQPPFGVGGGSTNIYAVNVQELGDFTFEEFLAEGAGPFREMHTEFVVYYRIVDAER